MYENLKNYSIKSLKECLFFVFCLCWFLSLSNNTLHVMFYTYICYWNTFKYTWITQITFHGVKQSHSRVTSKDIYLLFIIFFLCLFLSCLDFVCYMRYTKKLKDNLIKSLEFTAVFLYHVFWSLYKNYQETGFLWPGFSRKLQNVVRWEDTSDGNTVFQQILHGEEVNHWI